MSDTEELMDLKGQGPWRLYLTENEDLKESSASFLVLLLGKELG